LNSIRRASSFGNCRVLESKPALLLNDMADQFGRDRTLQYWRQRLGVITLRLFGELRGMALTALCGPNKIASH
jgi:hypothetical protein